MRQPIPFNTPSLSLAEIEITPRRMTRGTVTAEAEVAEEVCEAGSTEAYRGVQENAYKTSCLLTRKGSD